MIETLREAVDNWPTTTRPTRMADGPSPYSHGVVDGVLDYGAECACVGSLYGSPRQYASDARS